MKFKLSKKIVKIAAINLALFIFACSFIIIPSTVATQPQYNQSGLQSQNILTKIITQTTAQQLVEQAERLFEAGRFSDASSILQKAIGIFRQSGDNLGEAEAQSNLSLVFEQLGLWQQATEAIKISLNLLGWDDTNYVLKVNHPKSELLKVLAPTLDILAGQQLRQGNSDAANETAKRAEKFWRQLGDNVGVISSRINQAQALRFSGFNRRAFDILESVKSELQLQPDSVVKVTALRSLGNVQQKLGELDKSQETLQQTLKIAQNLKLPQEISLTELSLGNTTFILGKINDAIIHYQYAAKWALTPINKAQAQINQLNLLVNNGRTAEAKTLIPIIQSQLPSLPNNQAGIYARINFARTIIKIADKKDIASILATSIQQASSIKDQRALSYGLGNLAWVYEQNKQWQEALKLTKEALSLSQQINAPDITYRWQWQLGRILKAQQNISEAIKAYDASVNTLSTFRTDLAGANREIQFNFRDSVEPVYRQSVELLLQEKGENKPDLDKVRKRIEALQLAELDNYFREACLNNQFVALDKVVDNIKADTAIIYPIILENQLEIILKVPKLPLIGKTSLINSQEVEQVITEIRDNISEPDQIRRLRKASQQLYKWLIKPVEAELKKSKVKTLVFIPDGTLRNIPMAALYDESEQKYLVEKYAIAVSPGLQLFTPKPLARQSLNVLAGGLSKIPPGEKFEPLPNVETELKLIQKLGISTIILYNDRFKSTILENTINTQPFRVVHLATHGKFSSKAKDTFILASDKRIYVDELDKLLKSREWERTEPIELLVLSACETAAGDNRAALGLAGVALRAGVRSTLASLWQIGDNSTAEFIEQFYHYLTTGKSKAEALQLAQLEMLKDKDFNLPLYWAPYVLVGNWL
ncbi:MAG: CHAT domain-containing protein [Scytonematopsis contorta HA4267-MV1]|jgi:CHAT domain-containing protein/Arc/MetJ-type ribon-helix-helix transcriptional regulator|nr:CHAT domain-containing protein [Scytonematopsis contorta HA4267-MV1]